MRHRFPTCLRDGTWIKPEEVITPRYWRDHCRKPVRFADAAKLLLDLPEAVLLEVGPGQPLTILARQQRGSRTVPIVASMPERAAEAGDSGTMLEALGRLWTAGIQPDWGHVLEPRAQAAHRASHLSVRAQEALDRSANSRGGGQYLRPTPGCAGRD